MNHNVFSPRITSDLFRMLMDAEHVPSSKLVYASRKEDRRLPTLLLSVFESEGESLGSGARDELRRARKRAQDYQELYQAVSEVVECRVLKGPYLAGLYPEELRRPVGDLDLVLFDESSLWKAVHRILEARKVSQIVFALHGSERREVAVELRWSSDDDLLDGPASVELNTVALPGNFGTVPACAALPENAWVSGLLGLAEERFQRPFGVRDAIDVYILAASAPTTEEITEALRGYAREPEIVELLAYTSGLLDIGPLKQLLDALVEPAKKETARRNQAAQELRTPLDEENVGLRLAAGMPVHGFMLRRGGDRLGWTEVKRHEFSHGWIARTPVGDFLLCGGPVVDRATYEAALEELERVGDGIS